MVSGQSFLVMYRLVLKRVEPVFFPLGGGGRLSVSRRGRGVPQGRGSPRGTNGHAGRRPGQAAVAARVTGGSFLSLFTVVTAGRHDFFAVRE